MSKSLDFRLIKIAYDRGAITIEKVRETVVARLITAEEFEEITGVPY